MKTTDPNDLPTTDALSSWNDGKLKQSIVDFVQRAVTEDDIDFVPAASRVAVFDNDGTLWAEQPDVYPARFRPRPRPGACPAAPEWTTTAPFASLLQGDLAGALTGGKPALPQKRRCRPRGYDDREFGKSVRDWMASAKYSKTGRLYGEMVYQPMLELLGYLRANGFKTFILSGGGAEFMRVFTEEIYGIPPEQVIGSTGKLRFELRDGRPVLVKLPEVDFVDDKGGKPVGIHKHPGRRPVFAFGNSDGDLQMLQWTADGSGARFMGIVHHTDADREWATNARRTSAGWARHLTRRTPGAGPSWT
jgi:hypothetical protein